VVLAGMRDAARASGGELRFHRGHADMARPLAAYAAAGVSHTSVLTATGAVLVWRSDDPQLVVREVQGDLAGMWRGLSWRAVLCCGCCAVAARLAVLACRAWQHAVLCDLA
jgi:hypothetical protein